MKVLLVHNRYQQHGGEDAVVLSEKNLLVRNGLDVQLLENDNDGIIGLKGKIGASMSVFYSTYGVDLLKTSIATFIPDVVHVHNWFPTFSPGIFRACHKRKVPVVHTLHNYRLLCAKGSLYRRGAPCEDCIGTSFRVPGIVHGCYRGSHLGSAVATAGMLAHWHIGTWHKTVDRFIALSEFAKKKLIEGGIPAAKLVVKPNFLDYDPGVRPGDLDYFVFVGRLTEEKGILTLLQCWREDPKLPLLRIVGSGPLEDHVRAAAGSMRNIEWLGSRNSTEVLDIIGRAKALLCPSLYYEGMPRVVIEAMAVGTPVIASRLGTYLEMIVHNKSGLLFDSNSRGDLLACVRQFNKNDSTTEMRMETRTQFETRYSGAVNFTILRQIYEGLLTRPTGF
jgi:glycosyltransferase involved in cell wall biosynthesis